MDSFTRSDIERSFGRTIFARGLEYFKDRKVTDAWIDSDGDILGFVRGSASATYTVSLFVEIRGRQTVLTSNCTCPYHNNCKHGAAVALYALGRQLRTANFDDFDEEEDEEDGDQTERPGTTGPGSQALLVLPKAPAVSAVVQTPQEILEWLGHVAGAAKDPDAPDPAAKFRIFYVLSVVAAVSGLEIPVITPVNRSVLKSGALGATNEIKAAAIINPNKPKHWTATDVRLLTDMSTNCPRLDYDRAQFRLDGRHGTRLLTEILRTGRCTWDGNFIVSLGPARAAAFRWIEDLSRGVIKPSLVFDGEGKALSTTPPWYVDVNSMQSGPLDCSLAPGLASALIRMGAIGVEHISTVQERVAELDLPESLVPNTSLAVKVSVPEPTPCLHIDFETCKRKQIYWGAPQVSAPIPFGRLTFEYDGHPAPADRSDIRIVSSEAVLLLKRNLAAEQIVREYLLRWGWKDANYCGWEVPNHRLTSLCMPPLDSSRSLEPIERVSAFVQNEVPRLIASGWKIDVAQNFRIVPEMAVEWDISLDSESGIDWFQFQLGIRVEGRPYDLKSVLAQLFREQGNSVSAIGRGSRDHGDHMIFFGMGDKAIRLSRKRLNAILQPLVELFGNVEEWPEDLRMPKSMLSETQKFSDTLAAAGISWKTSDELKLLQDRLESFDHLEPMSEPEGFLGELRGYQREGLAWMQFLREFGFGGVLADDMGLGKTVQVLAHIQTEKESGRMTSPCLIVAPTSTMPNWRREAERFVPGLKVVTLQGGGRTQRFAELDGADIALTTFPLLGRDKDRLTKTRYHLLVLDEAQNVKNATTAAAKAARELKANHRLCLSGTPVENHLGELWALFHFLMPGFLGSELEFRKRFRTPIEKSGDKPARDRLARRIRPFMLRRTKSQVVKELPEKTEIIERIAFEDPQRDLYESIRVAMDEQVRKLIASQGFDKSRIQILDALLKLRQVCCDPRLVRLESAKAVTETAKLDRLVEMLAVLIEEGRRVLVFSQFTSMLDLIEMRLREQGTKWVRISGDTKDRETPVRQFQAGEVPVFLISLKAGGTGLNLTAADTVILYDPWWNPAVENQAIDRAHRIGQSKAVIVYKMVAVATIEEKMLEMQARKGDIARSILTEDAEGIRTLTAEDLRWVLSKD